MIGSQSGVSQPTCTNERHQSFGIYTSCANEQQLTGIGVMGINLLIHGRRQGLRHKCLQLIMKK